MKETPPSGQILKQCTYFFIFLGRRNGQRCYHIPIQGLWPMIWQDGQRLRKDVIEILVTRRPSEKICGWTSLNGQKKKMKVFVSYVNAYKRATSAEQDSNDQGHEMLCSVDMSQSLY